MGKTNGFMKKTLFALLAVLAAVSFLPKNAEAATVRLDQKKFTLTAGERFTLNIKGTGKKQHALRQTSALQRLQRRAVT